MAIAKRIIFLRNNEALIKVDGVVGAVTITLATDLLGSNEVINGTPTVNITSVSWSGLPSGSFTISRGANNLVSGAGYGNLSPKEGTFYENGNNTTDITVTTTTAEMQVWIRLHKVAGYATKIEPEQFGSYDNPNAAGS